MVALGAMELAPLRTLVRTLSVLGVIVALAELSGPAADAFVTMARKAAVLGEGGGNETGPPMTPAGVRPVPAGVRPVPGVRPVRKEDESKMEWWWPWACEVDELLVWGPASMAGDKGPERRELGMDHE